MAPIQDKTTVHLLIGALGLLLFMAAIAGLTTQAMGLEGQLDEKNQYIQTQKAKTTMLVERNQYLEVLLKDARDAFQEAQNAYREETEALKIEMETLRAEKRVQILNDMLIKR